MEALRTHSYVSMRNGLVAERSWGVDDRSGMDGVYPLSKCKNFQEDDVILDDQQSDFLLRYEYVIWHILVKESARRREHELSLENACQRILSPPIKSRVLGHLLRHGRLQAKESSWSKPSNRHRERILLTFDTITYFRHVFDCWVLTSFTSVVSW